MIGQWLNIEDRPPALDVWFVARTADEYGYGHNVEAFTFDSSVFTSEEAAMFLQNHGFTEWMGLAE